MKKSISIILALAVLAGIALFYAGVDAEQTGAICQGRVYYNSLPVDYPQIKLYNDQWCYLYSSTGGPEGYFVLECPTYPAGYYRLCIRKDSDKWQHVRFYYNGANTTAVGNVNLVNLYHSEIACPD